MAFYSRWVKWWRGGSSGNRYGVQRTEPDTSVHEHAPNIGVDGALQVSTVWACVALICENVASLPLNVYIKDQKTGRRRQVDHDDKTYNVLHTQPNEYQTSMEFWMVMLMSLLLRGNAFARKRIGYKDEVNDLWPLSADNMEVELTTDKRLIYRYWDGADHIEYTSDDIFHLRGMGSGLVGMSRLDYMRSSVGLSINAQNQTNKTFARSGRRPGILYTGGHVLKPEQRAQTKKKFNDIVKGTENELYLLEGEFKFEPLGMSPADVQLLETRKFSVQDLARWLGVPSVLINDTQETTALGSSVEQIIEGFYKLNLRPLLTMLEQAIEKRILTVEQRSKGMFVKFNMDALLRANLKDRMEVAAKAVQNGLKTRNECRAYEDDDPIDGADELTAQSNLLPLNRLGEQTTTGGSVPPDTVRQ